METTNADLPNRIIFIADAHLGMPGDTPERSKKLVDFLSSINKKVSHLYIVGDLFDFWFEYDTVIPKTSPQVIFELYNLVKSGTKTFIFAGNHDYWLGSYLSDSVGLEIVHDDKVVEHQNLKILIHHGDGLYPKDHGYRLLKRILRNRISIFLFSLIHPDLAIKLAKLTSKTSRNYLSPKNFELKNTNIFRIIADENFKNGINSVVFGHSHVPLIEEREKGSLILLGDWIKYFTYITLENGKFSLNSWNNVS
jgi:UDP-2,3-diacylglucosamine hydrolase